MHIYETVILEKQLDTFGHVNNATYLEILEEARWDLMTQKGYGLKEVQERGIGPVVLDIFVAFKKELRLREKIRIETVISDYQRKIGHIDHVIFNSKNEIAVTAKLTMGLFDLKARRLVLPTPEWINALEGKSPGTESPKPR
jgi:thioesterase-3